MKNIIRKSITVITIIAMALTLAMPVTAEAATKKAPKINKTKVTLTITKKKTKPTVQLKVKNTAGKKVKWTSWYYVKKKYKLNVDFLLFPNQ